ncbi:hypothetical protein Ahy_A10g046980 [Arachis hypogaea]|uniref:Zinc finger GRF-type domain-containing protein n=1 Tax=Arachis hypogaea TaxID=3818 RepID=A0A445B185_ARAHY|nr:hypothetical protein Ahy_A10g046980 [Arachis hypogaea]
MIGVVCDVGTAAVNPLGVPAINALMEVGEPLEAEKNYFQSGVGVGTDANPGRPFFGCPNYNSVGKRWCGLFVWANEFYKEGESRGRVVPKNENDEEWRMNFAWKIGSLESDVRALKLGGALLVLINLLVVAMLLWKW